MCGSELHVAAFAHPAFSQQLRQVHISMRSSFAAMFGRVMPFWMAGSAVLNLLLLLPFVHLNGLAWRLAAIAFSIPSLSCALLTDRSSAHQQPDNEVDRGIPSCRLESAGKSVGFISLVQDMRIDCCIRDSDRQRWCPLKTGEQSLHTLTKVCGSSDQTHHQEAVFGEIEKMARMHDDMLFAD
jgi:hypothetical protein